jgi:hypothetical protein
MSYLADISAPVISGAPRCAPQTALSRNQKQSNQPGRVNAVDGQAPWVLIFASLRCHAMLLSHLHRLSAGWR